MVKFLKKSIAIILTFVMLLSAMNVAVFAVGESVPEEYESIGLGITEVNILEGGELAWFEFIPETDGRYVFYSDTWYGYTRGYLFTSSMTQLAQSIDDHDFEIAYELVAGEKYYLATGLQNEYETSTYNIGVRLSPIQSISFKPVVFYETDSYESTDGEGNKYNRYSWYNYMEYTVTMTNGEEIENSSLSFYYDRWYEFAYEDEQSAAKQWTVGNTYNVYLTVDGYTATLPVSIQESPIASIDIDSYEIIEHTNGVYNRDYNPDTDEYGEEYYDYAYWVNGDFKYTINFKDGTSVEGTGHGFEYNGEHYGLSVRYE